MSWFLEKHFEEIIHLISIFLPPGHPSDVVGRDSSRNEEVDKKRALLFASCQLACNGFYVEKLWFMTFHNLLRLYLLVQTLNMKFVQYDIILEKSSGRLHVREASRSSMITVNSYKITFCISFQVYDASSTTSQSQLYPERIFVL